MTLYALTARFKLGSEGQRSGLATDFGDHMRQPLLHIRLVSVLLDDAGKRTGLLILMEAQGRDVVERFLQSSPFEKAGVYESVIIEEARIEAGGLN